MPQLSPEELRKDHGHRLLPLFIILAALPQVAVFLRVLARKTKHTNLWWDDYLVLLASVCLLLLWLNF